MPRPKSEFLKALGTMFEIWKALTEEVLARGGTDDQIRRIGTSLALRAKIAQLIISSGSIFELYLTPEQEKGGSIIGFDLDIQLRDEGFLDRTMSLEDKVVKDWIANPSTYPEEFKGKIVFLWKSQRSLHVAYLSWLGDCVAVGWHHLGNGFGYNPVLLKPLS